MRRPRHKLQVSTFPFLAVLLCAMGALILFLLVMDRRAKIVAQHKAAETLALRQAAHTDDDAARKAEWEKQREALHQVLLAEQQQLDDEAQQLANKIAEAGRALRAKQSEKEAAANAADQEAVRLARYNAQLKTKQSQLNERDKAVVEANANLRRLNREVADLEMVLSELRALKAREHQTYSLVPYHGKRGDTRKPIYVECVGNGLVFHSDRSALEGVDLNAVALRAEVERRAGKLEREVKSKSAESESSAPRGPYVLFLVRPDGITSYYHAMGLLRGYQVDFGYEMIDQDWVLDFSNELPPGKSPWDKTARTPVATAKPQPFRPVPLPGTPTPSVVGGIPGIGGVPGTGTGSGLPGTNTGGLVAGGIPGPSLGSFGGPAGSGWLPSDAGARGGVPGTGIRGAPGTGSGGSVPGTGAGGLVPGGIPASSVGSFGSPAGIGGPPAGGAGGVLGGNIAPGGIGFGGAAGGSAGTTGTGSRPSGGTAPGSGTATANAGVPGVGMGGSTVPGGTPASGLIGSAPAAEQAMGMVGANGNSAGASGQPGGSGQSVGGSASPGSPGGSLPGAAPGGGPHGSRAPSGNVASGVPGTEGPPVSRPLASALGIPATGSSSGGGSSFGNVVGGGGDGGPGGNGPLAGGGSGPQQQGAGPSAPAAPHGGAANSVGQSASGAPGGGAPGAGMGLPSSWTIPGTNVTLSSGNKGPAGPTGPGSSAAAPASPDSPEPANPRKMAFGGGSSDGAGSAGSGPALALPGPTLPPVAGGDKRKAPAAPPPLARAIGNRDFVIRIACYSDHVTVYPGGMQHWWKNGSAGLIEQQAVKDVQGLIAARQRSVRPGDPPYRPLIRFQLAPDGLGSYLHLYPRLDFLHVPMTRENLEE
jgi:hypothetical protein